MAQKSRVRVWCGFIPEHKTFIYPLLNNCQNLTNEEIDLFLDYPSRLADDLKSGNLDVALIPIIEYFRKPRLPDCSQHLNFLTRICPQAFNYTLMYPSRPSAASRLTRVRELLAP